MITVGLSSFFLPPEWVAAHGLRPERLIPEAPVTESCVSCAEGMCPYARAVAAAAMRADVGAVVFATTCDQQRRMAEWTGIHRTGVFLFHVPRVAKNQNSRQYYRSELERLGRFLVEVGGRIPGHDFLIEVMSRFDGARNGLRRAADALRSGGGPMGPRALAETLARFHQSGDGAAIRTEVDGPGPDGAGKNARPRRQRLALLGGPLFGSDRILFDWVEMAGGEVVLDGTEHGERTLAASFDAARLREDPVEELVRSYFDAIPDVSRRPNDGLLAWVGNAVRKYRIDGVILRHHVWCDQWMAEVQRIGQAAAVPVLAVDSSGRPGDRTRTRVEAFIEMLMARAGS